MTSPLSKLEDLKQLPGIVAQLQAIQARKTICDLLKGFSDESLIAMVGAAKPPDWQNLKRVYELLDDLRELEAQAAGLDQT